ncbi:MAG TPA: c-type cytochrome [Candidatus Acidoferrum sp.]|jgi:mono/diheme cytochrome c family protein|nr:c-type cytochrome [Candidatus Acidoferrum sp.]
MNRVSKVPTAGLLVAVSFLACVVLLSRPHKASAATPAPADVQDVYLDKCAVCHGKDGSGNTAKGRKVKAKDLRSAEIQKMTDAELIKDVSEGKGKDMDGFEKELGADMVKQLVAYCRAFAKK